MVVRILKVLVGGVAVLALLVVSTYLVSRAMGPSRTEREALALVDAPPPLPPGSDGFAALYSVRHDVPRAEQARVLAEDVRRFAASPPTSTQGAAPAPAWRSVLEDWPKLEQSGDGDPAWCSLRDPGCLAQVRAATDAYAGLIERNAQVLDRTAALAGYGYFLNPFQPRFDMPLPAYQTMTWLSTRNAWRFADGQVDEALAGTCDAAAMGRRMVEAGDSLIGSMIGGALVQGNATLLVEMLAELPRDHPLPAQCGQAFGLPVALGEGVCRTMLAEARFSAGGMRDQVTAQMAASSMKHDVPAWASGLLFDPERTVARTAPTFAWYCGEQARGLLAQDRPLRDPARPRSRWSLGCASNAVGCILADIAQPAYGDYGLRLQDADARIRTTAALLWLRGQDAIDEATLDRLPVQMRSPSRPLRLDVAEGTLGTAMYAKPRTEQDNGTWSLPLPASRLQASGASP